MYGKRKCPKGQFICFTAEQSLDHLKQQLTAVDAEDILWASYVRLFQGQAGIKQLSFLISMIRFLFQSGLVLVNVTYTRFRAGI